VLEVFFTILGAAFVLGGCVRLDAEHCGNQKGDGTCADRGGSTVSCNVCVAQNDDCVAEVPQGGCRCR